MSGPKVVKRYANRKLYDTERSCYVTLDDISLIVRTGAQRFRPVMLTSVTTIFGLLPLASNFSIDFINRTIVYGSQLSGFWVPLSQAIVSGLAFATLLTLVATPAMLALPHQLKHLYNGQRMRFQRAVRIETS